MLLLKLISPKKLPRKKSDWKFRHKCYRALLQMLLKRYGPGVINDIITFKDFEVRHTLRDEWFESELSRFGIDFTPTVKITKQFPFEKRKYHRSSLFSWKETMKASRSRQYCELIRGNGINLESNIGGTLQTSSEYDDILSIWLKEDPVDGDSAREGKEKDNNQKARKSSPRPKTAEPPKKTRKIHIKDTVKPVRETPVLDKPEEILPQDTYTKHAGFEENDIF